uniref:hypothetical protein n=1 Tax=Paractinoplanes polyasparticus TaxID=2856853 RepID=UPI001C84CC76|nr:hypothetical protein [Actinoplanes polyasparticus]
MSWRRPTARTQKRLLPAIYFVSYLSVLGLLRFVDPDGDNGDWLVIGAVYAIFPTLAAYIALTPKIELARQCARTFSWLPPVVGLVAIFYFWWYASNYRNIPEIGTEFFSTSAQVIPVFLLALTIDVNWSKRLNTSDLGWVILACVVGEGMALGGSAFEDFRSQENFVLTAASMATLLTALLMAIGAEAPGATNAAGSIDSDSTTAVSTPGEERTEPAEPVNPDALETVADRRPVAGGQEAGTDGSTD